MKRARERAVTSYTLGW